METFRLDDFVALLKFVEKKPGMYLAGDRQGKCRSIRDLYSFINGFQAGQHLKHDTNVLGEFTFWVCHHYGVPDGARNWYGHIFERAGYNDEAAFKLFFEHFEEYLKERESIGPEAIKARFLSMLKQFRKDQYPPG